MSTQSRENLAKQDLAKRDLARNAARNALESRTKKEDAAITSAAAQDPDAMPVDDLFKRKPGRPFAEITKRAVSIRLDPDVIDHFRAEGKGWQARMNQALRKSAGLK